MKRSSSFIVVVAVAYGCVSYPAPELSFPELGSSAAIVNRNGVTVSVEAYADREKQKAYFGDDLGSAGVIPVLVRIENKGSQDVELPNELLLRTPDGRVEKEASSTSIGVLFAPEPSMLRNLTYNSPYGWLFALAGMSSGAEARREAVDARIGAYYNKALKRGAVKPAESRQGFVYFMLTFQPRSTTQALVLLPLSNAPDAEIVEMPIIGLNFPSAPPQ